MSDSKSLNSLLPEVIILSNNEPVFIHNLSDLTLPIIFHPLAADLAILNNQESRGIPIASWRRNFTFDI
jgi:hypothetical protein